MRRFVTLLATYLVCLFVAFWVVAFLLWLLGVIVNSSLIEGSAITLDICGGYLTGLIANCE
jgi:hypothetical protein